MKIVDTHLHLWDLARFPYSWTNGIPALNRSFGLEEYRLGADGTGIAKAIYMECDVDAPHALDEARYAQSLADLDPLIAGIIAAGHPENDGFAAHLEALMSVPKLRGLRRVLHTQDDALSQSAAFRANLRRLPALGLSFDLCALPRQLPVALELVQSCPEVAFVLDHCGIPDIRGGALDPWRQRIVELAACSNVVACKISGLIAYADPSHWNADTLRPWFEHVIACFGWERVVWGGDWPVCGLTAPLRDWVSASQELAAAASIDEQCKLFHLNAERIYRV